MLKNIITAYDGSSATLEIIIMLLGAFALGYLLKKVLNSDNQGASLAADGGMASTFAKYQQDDLTIVEGIGPKIEELVKNAGIKNLKDLSNSNLDTLRDILKGGGERFAMHDPSSWIDQASLARDGRWAELEKFQDLLIGGRTS